MGDYSISFLYRKTQPSCPPYKTERYAFLRKTSYVQLIERSWLEQNLPSLYPTDLVVIAGDFNASETSDAFQELYNLGYLNHAIDNIYFPEKMITLIKAEAVDFVGSCQNLEATRGISDHLPVRVEW